MTDQTAGRSWRLLWVAVAGALALGVAWAWVCPLVAGFDDEQAAPVRRWLALAGLLAGALPLRLVLRRTRSGTAAALKLGAVLAAGGLVLAALVAVGLTYTLGPAAALAFGLSAVGAAVLLGLALALAACAGQDLSRGQPASIRILVAGACGSLAVGVWMLTSGYVLGRRSVDVELRALGEARDLVSVWAARQSAQGGNPAFALDAIGAALAPRGGLLVALDDDNRVLGGVGTAVRRGARLAMHGEKHARCQAGARVLPCATRRLDGGGRIVAAVPAVPISTGLILGFALGGLGVALTALGLGSAVAGGIASDLDRITALLDELSAQGGRPLAPPIVAGSLDEVGDLAVAMAQLRARLEPGLIAYQEAVEKAQAADRARTQFLTRVSSELRAPLESIIATARALTASADAFTAEQREDLRIVLSAATHLVELIDEVLDLSAIASGKVTLRLGEVDVSALVEEVAKSQRPMLHPNVEVELDVAAQARARADERRLRQVLTNIISNAVKFTERGSIHISVAAADGGAALEVCVRDTGPGIAANALPRLFREFVQLSTLRQRARGTGLGLAICKRLVEAHGGAVTAESELGVGSTFRVRLPTSGPESGAAEGEAGR